MVVNQGTLSVGMIKTAPPTPVSNPQQSKTKKMKVQGQCVSVQKDIDDTLKKFYPAWPYINASFTIPGTLKYDKISKIQLCKKLKVGGKPAVKMGEVKCEFKKLVGAMIPPPVSTPDNAPSYQASINLNPTHGKLKSA